jgi:hypothetical protein
LREKKDSDPFTGRFGVCNALLRDAPDNEADYERQTGLRLQAEDHGRQQWTRIGANWLLVSHGQPVAAYGPRRSTSMHVGLHYGRQANRDQALFSRRAMAAENKFVAWVQDSTGVLASFPSSAVIGKRTSAGNGFVSMRWREGPFPWSGSGGSENAEATVQLIGDAIVLDAEGRHLQGLRADQWERILGMKVDVTAAAVATRRIRTWSNSWGLPREHMLAIAGGSVFRLKSQAGGGPTWKAALDRLGREGLGRMRHEGFGWVSVNPPWLTKPFHAPKTPDPKEQERQKQWDPRPRFWPGLESVDRQLLLDTLAAARTVHDGILGLKAEAQRAFIQKVGDLASYAARVQGPADVVLYLDGLASRANPRGWDEVSEKIGEQLSKLKSIELARFFLNGIEILHG